MGAEYAVSRPGKFSRTSARSNSKGNEMAAEMIGLGVFKTMLDLAKGLKDINDATIRKCGDHRIARKNSHRTGGAI